MRFSAPLQPPPESPFPLPHRTTHRYWLRCSTTVLHNQHCISVAVESIPSRNSLSVGSKNQLAPGKRGNKEEKGRTRQMEVGNQAVDDLKAIAWINEKTGAVAA